MLNASTPVASPAAGAEGLLEKVCNELVKPVVNAARVTVTTLWHRQDAAPVTGAVLGAG